MRIVLPCLCALACLTVASTASAKKKADACAQRTKLLEERLAAIPTHVGFGLSPITSDPPTAELGEVVRTRGIIIDIKGTKLGVEGVLVQDGLKAFDDQADKIRVVEKMIGKANAPAYLRVDRRTPLEVALPFMCKLAEQRAVHVVVKNPKLAYTPYEPPPAPESIRELVTSVMQRKEPGGRAEVLSGRFMQAVKGCDALVSAVGAVNVAPPAERMSYLRRAVVAGVKACGCDTVDVPTVEALVIMMAAPISPPTVAFSPQLPCGQDAPYGLPMDATFDELVARWAAD
ncbi:MAG: hypothetical protein RIT81_25280 [Deltaproteobacteria bacterium]